jgi:hypothetical protein
MSRVRVRYEGICITLKGLYTMGKQIRILNMAVIYQILERHIRQQARYDMESDGQSFVSWTK